MQDETVRRILNGKGAGTRLRLTFREKGFMEIMYLLSMVNAKDLELDREAERLLRKLVHESGWINDASRQISVTTTATFSIDEFVARLAGSLEKLRVLS